MSHRHFWASLAFILWCAACHPTGTTPAVPRDFLPPALQTGTAQAQLLAGLKATNTTLRLTLSVMATYAPAPRKVVVPGQTEVIVVPVYNTQVTDFAQPTPTSTVPRTATATAQPLTATAAPVPESTPTARPVAAPLTRTPSDLECYGKPCQRELIAPDGQRRWPETCMNLGLDTYCYITFPGGQVTMQFAWPVVWSADGQFLAIPRGGNHDSLPVGYEVWSMAEGARTASFDYNLGRQRWSPTGHTVAYVKQRAAGAHELHLLDAATGADDVTRQCPAWATDPIKINDYFDWRDVCDNWVPPAGEPLILSFTVEPKVVSPGEVVTLTWTSVYATTAQIESRPFARPAYSPTTVPVSGTWSATIDPDENYRHSFELVVRDDAGKSDRRSRTVDLRCPEAFFFSATALPMAEACPDKPSVSLPAAEQAFERGWMIWLAPIPGSNSVSANPEAASVYVLYNTDLTSAWPQWERFGDLWEPGQPESDLAIEPPAGLYQPLRGFGKVWRDQPGVRSRLGWAVAPEEGFASTYQVKWDIHARPSGFFLRAKDGSILNLTLPGYWSRWQP